MPDSSIYDVIIIGGGYTGLVAARDLLRKGQRVLVLERSASWGGLAGGFMIEGASLERAYHHLFHTDHDILRLVAELGLQEKLLWLPSSVAIRHGGRFHSFMGPRDLLGFKPLSFPARLRLGFALWKLKATRHWQQFESLTAWDWVRNNCGAEAARVVWEPLLKGKFANFAEQVSMAWLWARVHIRANSRQPGHAGERLGYFAGGFQVFTDALVKDIVERGGTVRTGTAVTSLHSAGESLEVGTESETLRARKVIFTGSNPALARILPDEPALAAYRASLHAIPYLGAVCLVFSTPQVLGDFYWNNINEPDAPFLVFIRHTRLYGPEHYNGRQVYYIGAYLPQEGETFRSSPEQLQQTWFAYLKKLFPHFNEAAVSECHQFRFRDAQHVVTPEHPDRMPRYETPLKALYLANFSQIYPEDRGTNYAVREGHRIAALLE